MKTFHKKISLLTIALLTAFSLHTPLHSMIKEDRESKCNKMYQNMRSYLSTAHAFAKSFYAEKTRAELNKEKALRNLEQAVNLQPIVFGTALTEALKIGISPDALINNKPLLVHALSKARYYSDEHASQELDWVNQLFAKGAHIDLSLDLSVAHSSVCSSSERFSDFNASKVILLNEFARTNYFDTNIFLMTWIKRSLQLAQEKPTQEMQLKVAKILLEKGAQYNATVVKRLVDFKELHDLINSDQAKKNVNHSENKEQKN